jgi:hypothetical protein
MKSGPDADACEREVILPRAPPAALETDEKRAKLKRLQSTDSA